MDSAPAPQAAADVWTVGRLLNWTRDHFTARGLDQPRLCAELLLAESLQCRKIELYTRFDAVPGEAPLTRFRDLVKRAAKNEPIAYLLGRREFFSLDFRVTPDVLIPRPETETLVERAVAYCKTLADETVHLLDMGSGSGCIAVSIARFQARVRAVASDISAAAIDVATANAAAHGVSDRVRCVVADGLTLPEEAVPSGGFHLILSNPPYIAESAVAGLPPNVVDYEPRVALAAGDGLNFYRLLAERGAALLRPAGRCFVEIGMGQAAAVIDLFARGGAFAHLGTHRDLGGVDRVLVFERTI